MIKAILTFIFLFSLDNLLVIFLPIQPIFGNYILIPYLLLIGMCVAVFYDEDNYTPWLALIFGLIYDVYATNLLGIYIIMFPILVLLIKKHVVPITPINFVSIFYVSIVSILVVEVVVYLLVMMIIPTRNLSLFGMMEFVQYRLVITLIFNLLLLIITYLPLIKFLKPRHEKKVKTVMIDNTSA